MHYKNQKKFGSHSRINFVNRALIIRALRGFFLMLLRLLRPSYRLDQKNVTINQYGLSATEQLHQEVMNHNVIHGL